MTGLTETEAENMMRRYFSKYRGLDAWLRDAARKSVIDRTSRTGSGRLVRFQIR